MDDSIYDDCIEHVEKLSGKNVSFWNDLASKYNYESKESIRSDYRREARRRGYKLSESRQKSGGPKILIMDIETTPLLCYSFSLYPERISTDQIVKDWHILSYSAKWLFQEEVISEVLTPKEIKEGNDKRLTISLWNLFDESDVVVSYNGINFDNRRCATRFLINGLLPPSAYIAVDPIVTAKKVFDFSSRKMDYLAEMLNLDRKIHTDFSLWARCMNGDEDALEEINLYNNQDIRVLENLYLEMLPWIQGHPNWNLYTTDEISLCTHCGSDKLNWNIKAYKTLTNVYPAYRCENCGYVGRGRKGTLSKEKSKAVVR